MDIRKLPTKDEIREWLDRTGRNRAWLGEQCGGLRVKTVHNWFSTSANIPVTARVLIGRLMAEDDKNPRCPAKIPTNKK